MKSYPIQSSFEFGQVSWKFSSRFDLGIHGRGLDTCENMITDPRGPVESRGSFNNISFVSGSGHSIGQLVPFLVTKTEAYIAVLYETKLDIYDVNTGTFYASLTSPYVAADIDEVHFEQQDGNKTMYFAHPDHPPYELIYTAPSTWVFQAITFIAAPTEWAANNYPSTVAFGQGRSWWGGCPSNPQTLFGSRSYTVAGYADMTTGSLATDGFKFNITKQGKIEWINSTKNIQVGTDNAEHIMTSAGLIIKTGDIGHDEQSGYGSKAIKPVTMGLETLYLSPDGRKIRSMWYTNEEDYVTQDITYTADGEFPSPVKRFTLAKKPDMVIWCVLEDGTFASCTYFKEATESPIIGWHFHSLSDGTVKDLIVVETGTESILVALVHRVINGLDYIVLEKYDPDTLLDGREVEDHTGLPANTITSRVSLAGKTIQIIADGTVHPDITLDSGGNGTISYDASIIEMGFSFTAKMKTLPYISQTNQGTNASWKKRPNKIIARVYESFYPLINGIRPPDRRMTDLMDTQVPPFTGDISAANGGYDEFGQVTIEQGLPLKLTVTALLGDMGQSSV